MLIWSNFSVGIRAVNNECSQKRILVFNTALILDTETHSRSHLLSTYRLFWREKLPSKL